MRYSYKFNPDLFLEYSTKIVTSKFEFENFCYEWINLSISSRLLSLKSKLKKWFISILVMMIKSRYILFAYNVVWRIYSALYEKLSRLSLLYVCTLRKIKFHKMEKYEGAHQINTKVKDSPQLTYILFLIKIITIISFIFKYINSSRFFICNGIINLK